jgi:hypothetical protein
LYVLQSYSPPDTLPAVHEELATADRHHPNPSPLNPSNTRSIRENGLGVQSAYHLVGQRP